MQHERKTWSNVRCEAQPVQTGLWVTLNLLDIGFSDIAIRGSRKDG